MVGDCFNLWRVRIPRSLLRHESGIRFLDRNLLLEKYSFPIQIVEYLNTSQSY
jgi:hypothetical protein